MIFKNHHKNVVNYWSDWSKMSVNKQNPQGKILIWSRENVNAGKISVSTKWGMNERLETLQKPECRMEKSEGRRLGDGFKAMS